MASEVKQMAGVLKVLANENRLQILCELLEGPKTVGVLCERVSVISQSALSQHLAVLKAHGMVEDHKNGQYVTYQIADARMGVLMETLRANYCNPLR